MRLLLTNDDGIGAPGLYSLIKAFRDEAELYLVCPDRERSGTGHSITVFDPIRVERTEIDGVNEAWIVGGTPVDCVKLAIARLINPRIDMVISGINHGSNLGTDVLYSGTVAGAAEGVIMGVPSLAVSYDSIRRNIDLDFAGLITRGLVNLVRDMNPPRNALLNVNIPDIAPAEIKGVRICSQGIRSYDNIFEERQDPRGNTYYWLGGGLADDKNHPGSDVTAIQEGYISITPIRIDRTDYSLMKQYESILNTRQDDWRKWLAD